MASYFKDELVFGEPVTLLVAWVGAWYAGDTITWAFIVNEFSAPDQ